MKKGDKVICISDNCYDNGSGLVIKAVKKGNMYVVNDIGRTRKGHLVLNLGVCDVFDKDYHFVSGGLTPEGGCASSVNYWFCSHHFRKLAPEYKAVRIQMEVPEPIYN